MNKLVTALFVISATGFLVAVLYAQTQHGRAPADAIAEAQKPSSVEAKRPEQNKNVHDLSDVFDAQHANPSSPVFAEQPKKGQNSGFDFYRDPLNSDAPSADPDAIMRMLSAQKPAVMAAQRKLLETRYVLEPRLDPEAKMSRGKPLVVGPTARLPQGVSWEQIGAMAPEEIRSRGIFPYPSLPHPLQTNGGIVFPKMQIDMFPRLERVDVDFDIPEVFLPEFPPADLPEQPA